MKRAGALDCHGGDQKHVRQDEVLTMGRDLRRGNIWAGESQEVYDLHATLGAAEMSKPSNAP